MQVREHDRKWRVLGVRFYIKLFARFQFGVGGLLRVRELLYSKRQTSENKIVAWTICSYGWSMYENIGQLYLVCHQLRFLLLTGKWTC